MIREALDNISFEMDINNLLRSYNLLYLELTEAKKEIDELKLQLKMKEISEKCTEEHEGGLL